MPRPHEGRLAFGYVEELLPALTGEYTLKDVAKRTGLEPKLIERIYAAVGFSAGSADHLGEDDLELLHHVAARAVGRLPADGARCS